MLKVLSLPVDDGACGWYRVRQPLKALKDHTEHDTHIVDLNRDGAINTAIAFAHADIIYARQGVNIPSTKARLADSVKTLSEETGTAIPQPHAKWVMDIDDNTEIISPYSNHYQELGQEEFKHDGQWLWKDGERGFDLQANRERLQKYLTDLRSADLVTVTTKRLQDYALQYNEHVEIVPNTINFKYWFRIDAKPNEKIRIGWAGGSSHYEDLFEISKPLNRVLREFDAELYMFGHHFPGIIDEDNEHRVKAFGWIPFLGHSFRLMSYNLDIAIIPLNDLPFNHYKSPIKFLEFSAAGVPSVVANVPPYDVVVSNKNAMPYKTNKELYQNLSTLIKNPDLRKNLAWEAREMTKNGFSSDKWAKRHAQILENVQKGAK